MYIHRFFTVNGIPCSGHVNWQVDPLKPGRMEFWETCGSGEDVQQVKPAYQNLKDNQIANICELGNLFLTKRQKLYQEVCAAVLLHASGKKEDQVHTPFEVIQVAGDGRCGWRAILAAQNITAFQLVQRRGRKKQVTFMFLDLCRGEQT